MFNPTNKCLLFCASRITHALKVNISTRCTYSTLIQKHPASNELISIDDLYSKHLSDWSINDVSLWLSHIDDGVYSNHINCFEEQKIDGLTLQYLSENDLNYLGINLMGDRKHIMHYINDLFRFYNINTSISTTVEDQTEKRIAINIGDDTINNTNTDDIQLIPSGPSPSNIDENISEKNIKSLFHPDYTLPLIQLPQFENEESNISHNIFRIEYESPWCIDPFNADLNASMSQLFLSSPDIKESSFNATFNCDIDHENNVLILHGTFIELSNFLKSVYKLSECPIVPILPRISHFLMDCGELQRISKMFNVIPFIRNDGKLSFYSPTATVYAQEAIDAVKSLLKTLDCSSWFGSLNTSIIGTLLSVNKTKTIFTTNLSRYGYIQYWNRGHLMFETDYKLSRNIQRDKIYHLLLMKSLSPSNMNKMHQIIKDLISQHSSSRVVDIGLISFVLYQHKTTYFRELRQKHDVFIGGCTHSKTVYVCGATQKIREEILSELCDNSMYSSLSYCKLSEELEDYINNCGSLSHFRALKKAHNKQMPAQFVYNDEDKKTYLVTPSVYESPCNDFIQNILSPSLLRLKTNKDSQILYEYKTLMSKLSDIKQFLTPHIALDEAKHNLYVFHRGLRDKTHRKWIKNEIIRYQNMKNDEINVSAIYPWMRKFMHSMLKNAIHFDTNTALITLIEETQSIHIRCNDGIFEKLKHRLHQITNRVYSVPIYERLQWINHYELNNNVHILNDNGFFSVYNEGMYYIYNRDYLKSISWINKYFEILLQIGVSYNQFPNDEYILQRDVEFLLQILLKFNHLPNKRNKKLLFENESIVNFTLLMIYQCVLSTRYDLCLSIWNVINELNIDDNDNILIINFIHTVFVVCAKEFTLKDMKQLLIKSKILFQAEIIKFIIKTLKDYEKKDELQFIKDVLHDIHLDTDVRWTMHNI